MAASRAIVVFLGGEEPGLLEALAGEGPPVRRPTTCGRTAAWSPRRHPASGCATCSRNRVAATNGSSCTSLASPSSTARVAADDLTGHRQPLRDVHAHLLRERLDAAHVGHEPPLGLHDRPLGVGRRHPQVRGERDLQPAAVAVAVDRGDDRHGHPPPRPAGLLEEVGAAERVGHERPRATRGGFGSTVAKSSPAQNESPSPPITTPRRVRSRESSRAVATRASRVSRVSALSLSGRLRRTWATPPSTRHVTVLGMPPAYGRSARSDAAARTAP